MLSRGVPRWAALAACAVLATLVVGLDRISKDAAEQALSSGPAAFIPGIIDFRLAYNTGGAWGIFKGGRPFFLAVAAIAVLAAAAYLLSAKEHPPAVAIGLGLFVGGGIGNAIDRLAYGHVVDFINLLFINFPVFNVADSAITVGVALLVLTMLLASSTQPAEEEDNVDKNPRSLDGAAGAASAAGAPGGVGDAAGVAGSAKDGVEGVAGVAGSAKDGVDAVGAAAGAEDGATGTASAAANAADAVTGGSAASAEGAAATTAATTSNGKGAADDSR